MVGSYFICYSILGTQHDVDDFICLLITKYTARHCIHRKRVARGSPTVVAWWFRLGPPRAMTQAKMARCQPGNQKVLVVHFGFFGGPFSYFVTRTAVGSLLGNTCSCSGW